MAEYGYAYRSFSTYSTVRNEKQEPAIIKPFVPSLPKSKGSNSSEGQVTKKTIVPVTSRPYHDSAATTERYPSKGVDDDDDDDNWRQKTSPVRGSPRKVKEFPSPTKVHNEANRPQRFSPMANSTGWRPAPQPTPYSSSEGRKPVGSTIRNDNHDSYNGTSNGHGGDYDGNKERRKPIGSTVKNDNHNGYNGTNNGYGRKPIGGANNHDGHNGTNNGYGGDYGSNKEGRRPIGSTVRNDNHDGYSGINNGYGGDYGGNKEGRKPIGSTINHDGYNGTNNNGYGDKEGRKPIGSSNNGYGGYDGDDHYNKKEGYRPIRNNGYGIGNDNNREQQRPFGFGSTTRNDKYDDSDYGNNFKNREGNKHKSIGTRPKISSAWTTAPRKGTQLSEPTHDIEKALELLKMEAAKREHVKSNIGYRDIDSPTPLANWVAPPATGNNGSRFAKFDKGTGSPQHVSPTSKFETIFDGRDVVATDDEDDDYRGYGHVPVIDSREAEKKFKGTRV